VNAVFSSWFKQDLLEAEARYYSISDRLGSDLHERVKNAVRTIIRWEGGDHIGPHGFPCKHCRPFPFYICYQIEGNTVYFIGLVHEARHPDFIKDRKEI
jgi:hypothetical protein